MLIIPIPRLGVDRLADTTQDSQRAQVVVLDVVCAQAAEEADGGRGRVELGEFVLLDGFPVAGWCGINGRGLENDCRDAVGEGAVDDVATWGWSMIRTGSIGG